MKAFLENTTKTYAPEIPKGERPNATLLRRTAEAPTPTLLIQSLLLEERIKNLETTRRRRRSELKKLQPTQMDKVLKDLYEYNQEQLAHYDNEIRKRGPAAQKLKRQMEADGILKRPNFMWLRHAVTKICEQIFRPGKK